MPKVVFSSKQIIFAFFTGFISLAVGIGGGVITNSITTNRPGLFYEVSASEVFRGEIQQIVLLKIDVFCEGDKEIDDLVSEITINDGTLVEYIVTGIPDKDLQITHTESNFALEVPFLNPQEIITIQLLIFPNTETFQEPQIEIRARGLTASLTSRIDESEEESETLYLIMISTAIFTLIPAGVLIIYRRKPSLFFSKKHSDDNRDILSFIYNINGFYKEATMMRESTRQIRYWAESDYFTESCLSKKDNDIILRGIKTLEDLISYASIDETYLLLIYLNIVKLALAVNDKQKAKKYIELAKKGNHKVIEKRIRLDERLSKFTTSEM